MICVSKLRLKLCFDHYLKLSPVTKVLGKRPCWTTLLTYFSPSSHTGLHALNNCWYVMKGIYSLNRLRASDSENVYFI